MDSLKNFLPFLSSMQGNASLCYTGEEAVALLNTLYDEGKQMSEDMIRDLQKGIPCDGNIPCYPYIAFAVAPQELNIDATRAYGMASEPGVYGTTVTRPDIFGAYYQEQIDLLIKHHNAPVLVGKSTWPIPLPFFHEASLSTLEPATLWDMANNVPLPDLSKVDDSIANGTYTLADKNAPRPLALFTAERVDYSLHRLYHYCGTAPEHFQHFILLTNYQRYIDHFVNHALETLESDSDYTALVEPGDIISRNRQEFEANHKNRLQHLPQMPAYHLKRKDGSGTTFVNIGVGPTNAKNITDHLAVLRPHCWIMLGHCAGFRRSQHLGDYVLAHGYVRDDHVLDRDVPLWTPIPPIAEVQMALQEAVVNVTGLKGADIKTRMRTGTVVSCDDRNWEISAKETFARYNRTRAIALDLESASLATNGFRFRVPYGTLLCVSDKPLHGELKLKNMATQFYKDRVHQHMEVGLETIRLLRSRGSDILHSRKLRGFDEPPFR